MDPEPQKLLKQLLTQYGTSVIDDPLRFASLLNDTRKGEHKREANLLIAALREGVPQQLSAIAHGEPAAMLVQRLVGQLVDDAGLAPDAARWAVESWALALGLSISPAPPPTTPVIPVTQPAAPTTSLRQCDQAGAAGEATGRPVEPTVMPGRGPVDPRRGWLASGGWGVALLVALPVLFTLYVVVPRGDAPAPAQDRPIPSSTLVQPTPTPEPPATEATVGNGESGEAEPSGAESVAPWAGHEGSEIGSTSINPVDDAEMVWVPAGEFTMGSDIGNEDEKPAHTVNLSGYWIYKTEVTVAQYRKYCQATGTAMPRAPAWGWQEDHPVVNVNWYEAVAYAQWAGVSLPTEAQWEKAARGPDGLEFPWGNEWDASKCVNSVSPTKAEASAAVASFPTGASPYGCMDLAGNVWEWCTDWYQRSYSASDRARDPVGSARGKSRVLRGGSWFNGHTDRFRCGWRSYCTPHDRRSYFGFRCARRP